ncbi:MAG: hypothetical protein FWB78_08085 [Treponema sp.]|nr:hypothetical protein [Treponema sp.]
MDFAQHQDERTVLLTKEGLKKVISAFENKMETLVHYLPSKNRLTLSAIIIEQVRHFKRVVFGEEMVYKGYLYK